MSRDETPLPAADALRSDATRRGRRGYFARRAGGEGAAGRTRLLRSEISSCGAANRGGVREHGTCARRSSRPSTRSSTGWMYRRTWDEGGLTGIGANTWESD